MMRDENERETSSVRVHAINIYWNGLLLQFPISKFMLVSTKTNIHHLTQSCPYIQFQDTNVAVTSSEQLLGVTVDNTYLFLLSRI